MADKPLRLDISQIEEYMECPAKYYFGQTIKTPQKTDYSRLCGSEVRSFIKCLYNKGKSDKRFWFETLTDAQSAWFCRWEKVLEKSKDTLISISSKEADKFGKVGWYCIKNYWERNINLPDPVFIEKRYTSQFMGIELTEVIGQVRTITIESIVKQRPEIVKDGILSGRYNPEYVMDLKVGYNSGLVGLSIPESKKMRIRCILQRYIKAAAYTVLYQEYNEGKLPVGFLSYRLGDSKTFFVKGDEAKLQRLLRETVTQVVESIRNESFPKLLGKRCRKCDFMEECMRDGI